MASVSLEVALDPSNTRGTDRLTARSSWVTDAVSSSSSISNLRSTQHPPYTEYAARIQSFVGWPRRYIPKTPEELSSAGFFYIGSADRVTCFQCGITLRDWEEDHDPVTEHQRYSPDCSFINVPNLDQLGVTPRSVDGLNPVSDCDLETDSIPTASASIDDDLEVDSAGDFENDTSAAMVAMEIALEGQFTNIRIQQNMKSRDNSSELSNVIPSKTDQMNPISSESTVARNPDITRMKFQPRGTKNQEEKTLTSCTTKLTDESLKAENRRLKDMRSCKICRNKNVEILFLPCGHLVTCTSCSESVRKCNWCNRDIAATVKTYLP